MQSFNVCTTLLHRYSVIPTLADILSESVKEKVTRIVLAVFRNLIEKSEDPAIARENCIQMVQCKVCLCVCGYLPYYGVLKISDPL